jgi:hypothetical protein
LDAAGFEKRTMTGSHANTNRSVKVASLQMPKQMRKIYNRHVEGRGKNGHTYYASGILVRKFGAGFRQK